LTMCNKKFASFSLSLLVPLFSGEGRGKSCDVKDWYFMGT
jgi:hypothetical protein